jgi:hypothetical protein
MYAVGIFALGRTVLSFYWCSALCAEIRTPLIVEYHAAAAESASNAGDHISPVFEKIRKAAFAWDSKGSRCIVVKKP